MSWEPSRGPYSDEIVSSPTHLMRHVLEGFDVIPYALGSCFAEAAEGCFPSVMPVFERKLLSVIVFNYPCPNLGVVTRIALRGSCGLYVMRQLPIDCSFCAFGLRVSIATDFSCLCAVVCSCAICQKDKPSGGLENSVAIKARKCS